MGYHSFPTASDRAAIARRMAARLLCYAELLDAGKPEGSDAVQFERLQFLNAGIDLEDDGNFAESRDVLLDEMRWDEFGEPVREDTRPLLAWMMDQRWGE